MTAITPILTGVAAHIGTYADAVAVSGCGTQIFVSGTPGLREDGTPPEDFWTTQAGCRRRQRFSGTGRLPPENTHRSVHNFADSLELSVRQFELKHCDSAVDTHPRFGSGQGITHPGEIGDWGDDSSHRRAAVSVRPEPGGIVGPLAGCPRRMRFPRQHIDCGNHGSDKQR
jgi:hypothetical protein